MDSADRVRRNDRTAAHRWPDTARAADHGGARPQQRWCPLSRLDRLRRSARPLLHAALVAALLAGCAPAEPPAEPTLEPAAATPAAGPTAAAPTAAGPAPGPAAAAQAGELVPGRVTELATGLDMPWGLTFLPDGSALVSGRVSGQIHRVPAGGGAAALVGEVPGVERSAEGGLLGLAASPAFAADRTVFAYVSAAPTNRVVALRLGDDLRSLRQERVVLDGIATAHRHHGGRLQFGPDGHLWITTGDAFQPPLAPRRESLNGKVLRIRPDGSVPPDNPFGTPVYTTGHRNVQGLTFGPDGAVYAAELGLNEWDEVNVLRAGADYGWPGAEGPSGAGGERPLFALRPTENSPSGVAYAGGAVWMAGLRGQRLWRLPVAGGERAGAPVAYLAGEYGRLRTVQLAPDGALWVTTSNTDETTLGGVAPRAGDDRILRIELVPAQAGRGGPHLGVR